MEGNRSPDPPRRRGGQDVRHPRSFALRHRHTASLCKRSEATAAARPHSGRRPERQRGRRALEAPDPPHRGRAVPTFSVYLLQTATLTRERGPRRDSLTIQYRFTNVRYAGMKKPKFRFRQSPGGDLGLQPSLPPSHVDATLCTGSRPRQRAAESLAESATHGRGWLHERQAEGKPPRPATAKETRDAQGRQGTTRSGAVAPEARRGDRGPEARLDATAVKNHPNAVPRPALT